MAAGVKPTWLRGGIRVWVFQQALDKVNCKMGADTVVLGSQQYLDTDATGNHNKFVNAIRRAIKSPDYTTTLGAFTVG